MKEEIGVAIVRQMVRKRKQGFIVLLLRCMRVMLPT